MKTFILDFLRRGLVACGFGPLVLALVYAVLRHTASVEMLAVDEVCVGIVSLFMLAFVAGGMNVLYQVERLPLMAAVAIHGSILYLCYLAVYLLNGWLQQGMIPLLVFTGVFVIGYLTIWAIIYAVIRKRTARLNQLLQRKQDASGNG